MHLGLLVITIESDQPSHSSSDRIGLRHSDRVAPHASDRVVILQVIGSSLRSPFYLPRIVLPSLVRIVMPHTDRIAPLQLVVLSWFGSSSRCASDRGCCFPLVRIVIRSTSGSDRVAVHDCYSWALRRWFGSEEMTRLVGMSHDPIGRSDRPSIPYAIRIPAPCPTSCLRHSTAFSTILTILINHKVYHTVIATCIINHKHPNINMIGKNGSNIPKIPYLPLSMSR